MMAGYLILGENMTSLSTWAALAIGFVATVTFVAAASTHSASAEEEKVHQQASILSLILLVLNPLIISLG